MIMTILRLFFFSISMLGYIFYGYRKTKIQIEFIPIIVISVITIGLFFGGIFGGLGFAAIIFFILGIILFEKESLQHLKKTGKVPSYQQYLTPGMIVVLILAIYYFFLFREQRLIHYDNFSHWAIMIKNLLVNDALPTAEDNIISFNSYPPGSALFIYYFSRIIGPSEGITLPGQMTILLSSLLILFSFSNFPIIQLFKKESKLGKQLVLNTLTVLLVLYLLAGPTSVHDLLVDNLLTILGVAIFSMVYFYIQSPQAIILPLIVMTSFISLIKNSGAFFAIPALCLYGISIFREMKKGKDKFKMQQIYIFLPFIAPLRYKNYGQIM